MMRPVLEPGVPILQQGLGPPKTLLVAGRGIEFGQTSAIAGVFGVLCFPFPYWLIHSTDIISTCVEYPNQKRGEAAKLCDSCFVADFKPLG